MPAWFQQEWCSSFVLTLGHFLWQGTLIAVALAIALRATKFVSARYWLSLTALLLMAACPIVTLGWLMQPVSHVATLDTQAIVREVLAPSEPMIPVTPTEEASDVGHVSNVPVSPPVAPLDVHDTAPIPPLPPVDERSWWQQFAPQLTTTYLCGVALMLLRLVIGLWGGRRLRRRVHLIDDSALLEAMRRQAAALGLKLLPVLAYCERVTVPTVVGVLKPMILLPVALTSGLSAEQIESVLAHELAHLRRYDHLVNLLQRVIESLLFAHPAVWWVSHRIRDEREHCCDDLVVACGAMPLDYAKSLLRVAELSRTSMLGRSIAAVSLLATGDKPSNLRQRIARLLGESATPSLRISPRVLMVSVCIPLIALIVTIQSGASNQKPTLETDPFSITTPDGLTVELLGVANYLSLFPEGKSSPSVVLNPWWRPDGERLEQSPLTQLSFPKPFAETDKKHWQDWSSVAVRIRGRNLEGVDNTWVVIDGTRESTASSGTDVSEASVVRESLTNAGPLPGIKSGIVRVAVGAGEQGPWQRVRPNQTKEADGPIPEELLVAYEDIADVTFREVNGQARLDTLPIDVSRMRASTEMQLVDVDGQPVKGAAFSIVDGKHGWTYPIPLVRVAHFRFRLRPYRHWITFENVSFQPGHKTEVKSSVGKTPELRREPFIAKLLDGVEVELLGVAKPGTMNTSDCWRPDGGSFQELSEWPKRLTQAEDATHELLCRVTGLQKGQEIAWRIPTLVLGPHVRDKPIVRVAFKSADNETSPRIGITESTWGPWQKVNAAGEIVDRVKVPAYCQAAYETMKPDHVQELTGAVRLCWINTPTINDLARMEVVAIDTLGKSHQPYGATAWGNLNPQYADVFKLSKSQIDHYEYRLLPFRHWVTFENVSLAKGHQTTPKVRTETLRFLSKVGEAIEIELVGVGFHPSEKREWWRADGSRLDQRPFEKLDGSVLKGDPKQVDCREFAVQVQGLPKDHAVTTRFSRPVATALLGQSRNGVYAADMAAGPFTGEKTASVGIGLSLEPLGPAQGISAEGSKLAAVEVPPDVKPLYDLIQPVRVDSIDGQTELVLKPIDGIEKKADWRLVAIDNAGQETRSTSSSNNGQEVTLGFKLPRERIARFEYRMRPYRHWATFENVSLQPGQTTDVKFKVESIPVVESNALRCRLVAVPTTASDESPDLSKSADRFARGEDVTFAVELQNVSDKPVTLIGVRHEAKGQPMFEGKLAPEFFAPHLFELEFTDADGHPIPRASRAFLEMPHLLNGALTHEIAPGKSLVVQLRPAKFHAPMDHRLPPGSYLAKVRYRGASDKALAYFQKNFPNAPRAKAWSGEVTSNEVAFMVANDPSAPKPQPLVWGAVKDGLQAAVEFQPLPGSAPTNDPPGTFPTEPEVRTIFHVKNVSDRTIKFVSEMARQLDEVTATNETGETKRLEGRWISGWPIMVRWTLRPGEIAELHALTSGIGLLKKPGKYTLRYSINFRSLVRNNGKGDDGFPKADDWQQVLVTGETPVTIRARAGRGAPVSALTPTAGLPISDDETNPPNNANGELRSNPAAGAGDPSRAQNGKQEAAGTKPALRITGRVVDAETRKVIDRIRMVPTSVNGDDTKNITWQSQYLKDFTDGRFLYETDRPWDKTRLRIEAAGYRPAITRVVNKGEVVELEIKLERRILAGVVRLPNGQPAAKAQVGLASWTNEVNLHVGKLSYGHHGEKLRKVVETDEQGRFVMPAEIDPSVLVVAHAEGYAERANAETTLARTKPVGSAEADDKPAEDTAVIELQPWGRVEGRVLMGDKPVVGAKYHVYQGRADDVHVNAGQSIETDAEGRFVVEQLPPAKHGTCQRYASSKDGKTNMAIDGLVVRFEIPSGRTTTLALGSPGRTLIGKLALPAGFPHKVDWANAKLIVSLQAQHSHRWGDTGEDIAAWSEFLKTDEGKLYGRANVAIAADGSFRIEGLPPAEYELNAIAETVVGDAKPAEEFVSGKKRFSVPGDASPDKVQTIDLGTIDLKPLVTRAGRGTSDTGPTAGLPNSDEAGDSRILITYDIPGAEAETKVFVERAARGMEAVSTESPLKNGKTLERKGLAAGDYNVARSRTFEIARGENGAVRSGAFLDYQRIKLEPGETKSIDFKRSGAKPATGQVRGWKELGVEVLVAFVCFKTPRDPQDFNVREVTIFDARNCAADGSFKTEPLAPGDYIVVVQGFEPLPRQAQDRTGDILPRFVGTAKLTIPATGDPKLVEVTLHEAKQPGKSTAVKIKAESLPVAGDFSKVDDPDVLLDQLAKSQLPSLVPMTGGGFFQQPGAPPQAMYIPIWENQYAGDDKLDPRIRRLIELGDRAVPRVHQRLIGLTASDLLATHLTLVLRSVGGTESVPVLIKLMKTTPNTVLDGTQSLDHEQKGFQASVTQIAVTSALWKLTGRRQIFTPDQWEKWWLSVKPDFVVPRDRQRPEFVSRVTLERVNALANDLATNEVAARERLISLGPAALPHLLKLLSVAESLRDSESASRSDAATRRLAWVIDELGATDKLPAKLRRDYFTQRFEDDGAHVTVSPIQEQAACRALSHCSFADFCHICLKADGRRQDQYGLRLRGWMHLNTQIFSRRFNNKPAFVAGDPSLSAFWNDITPAADPAAEIAGAVPVIVAALSDKEPLVRHCAAKLADVIGLCSAERPAALIVALRDHWLIESDANIRLDIGLAMARFSTPLVLEAISSGLRSERPEIVSDAAALMDWVQIELNDKTRADFERLVELTHHENNQLRNRAVRSLRGKAPSLLAPEFERLITDKVEDIRKECAFALRDRPDPKFADILFKLADDPSEQVRIEALSSIANLDHPPSMKRLLPHLRDKKVHGYAVSALASMGGKDSLPLMMSELEAGNDVGGMVYQHLRRLTGEKFEEKSEPWLAWWKKKKTAAALRSNPVAESGDQRPARSEVSPPLGFSERREIVLSVNSLKYMLDLDGGLTMDPPQKDRPEQKKMDVCPLDARPNEAPAGLQGRSLRGVRTKPDGWNMSEAELQQELASNRVGALTKLPYDPDEKATYFFRTADGTDGILQLLAQTDEPKGIRLCYKTFKASKVNAEIKVGMTFDELIALKGRHYRLAHGMRVGQLILVYDDIAISVDAPPNAKGGGKVTGFEPGIPREVVQDVPYADEQRVRGEEKFAFPYFLPGSRIVVGENLVNEANALASKEDQIQFLIKILPPIDQKEKRLSDRQLYAIRLLSLTDSDVVIDPLLDRLDFQHKGDGWPASHALGRLGERSVEPVVKKMESVANDLQKAIMLGSALIEIKQKKYPQFLEELRQRKNNKLPDKLLNELLDVYRSAPND
ncbi:MAG: M56 family metallopeptidase [Planctomycetaceae bacterium]